MNFLTLIKFLTPCIFIISATQAKKNILLLMADDQNDWIGAFGGNRQVKTPNIDKFAKKAVIFRNAQCSSPVCNSSRTSMLTGLRPTTSKVFGNGSGFFRRMPEYKNIVTLPQLFMNQGYFTASGGKIYHLSGDVPEDSASWNKFYHSRFPRPPMNPIPPAAAGFEWGISADSTAEVTDEFFASNFIADYIRKGTTKPFFLSYGTHLPHSPLYVPKKFFDMYDKDTLIMPEYLATDLDDVPKPMTSNHRHDVILAAKEWPDAVQAYLAGVSFADHCIGNVLKALDESPYKDSTIVLIMGDHGYHLGEKNHWGKNTNWEEATRTFLVIYDPSIAKPGIVDQAVSLQDIYPTLAELTGSALPAWVEGRSLVPILKNPQQNNFIGWALVNWQLGKAHTFRTDKWALIRFDDATKQSFELYDMFADPLQHTNLAGKPENATIINKLSADIDRIIKREAPLNLDIYGKAPTVSARIPKDGNKATALLNSKIYRLKAYSEDGKLVREFKGRGSDIERMIALGGELGLPSGQYVYRVFDLKNQLIETINASWSFH